MESDEPRFKHIGLSSDGKVIFCEMDNGKTYAMRLRALTKAEDWNPKAKPRGAGIIHDGYAAFVEFDCDIEIDFPSDFVLHMCEPSYRWYKGRRRALSAARRMNRGPNNTFIDFVILGFRRLVCPAMASRHRPHPRLVPAARRHRRSR